MNAQDAKALADAQDEGKVRLSLVDVMYGVIMGFGFNFFVDRSFRCCINVVFARHYRIVCDWLFVHKPYWTRPELYTNWVFVIDLVILLAFAFMMRFAVKPPHVGELICLGVVLSLYALWDIVFREGIREGGGREPFLDFFLDSGAAIGFFLLAKYADARVLSSKLIDWTLPNWVGFNIEVKNWMAIAILLYAVIGPHPLSDMILRRSPRPL